MSYISDINDIDLTGLKGNHILLLTMLPEKGRPADKATMDFVRDLFMSVLKESEVEGNVQIIVVNRTLDVTLVRCPKCQEKEDAIQKYKHNPESNFNFLDLD